MQEQYEDTEALVADADLQGLAMGVELTLASVLQGIAMAILIPQVAELIASGQVAKFPYIPASLLLVFLVWVTFVVHSFSFISWPFDLLHNLLYFLVVTAETVLLSFLDSPELWFLALLGFGVLMGLNHAYNLLMLRRHAQRYHTPARRALYQHMLGEQRASLWFMGGYLLFSLLGLAVLGLNISANLASEQSWLVAGLMAVVWPVVHTLWQARMVAARSQLLVRARRAESA